MQKSNTDLPPLDLRQRYTIDETARYLRVSRAHVYQLIKAGTVKTIPDGRRTFVPGSVIAALSALPEPATRCMGTASQSKVGPARIAR